MKDFHQNVEMLLEYYSATCMPENEAQTFIQYFDSRNKIHYLADGYDFLKEIAPKTSIPSTRLKGLPATLKVQQHYKELVYQYCMEEITIGYNEDKSPIIKLGVVRIPDIGLLLELASYNDEGNFDRYVAFGHALAYEKWADKLFPYIEPRPVVKETRYEKMMKPPTIRSPFDLKAGSNPFGIGGYGSNPFGIFKK